MIDKKSSISTKKCSKAFAEYIWNSPCLKPFFFNPFLLAIVIILVVLLIDTIDGKCFDNNDPINILQHTFTSFILISCLLVVNNVLIKHKYRQEKDMLKAKYEPEDDDSNESKPKQNEDDIFKLK
jgi:hypothetical protein